MRFPDMAVSDKAGVLALVVEIQAWLPLCLKDILLFLILSLWVETVFFFPWVYTRMSVRAFNPCLPVTTAQMFNLVSHRLESLQPVRAVSPSDTDQGSVRASEAVESSVLR